MVGRVQQQATIKQVTREYLKLAFPRASRAAIDRVAAELRRNGDRDLSLAEAQEIGRLLGQSAAHGSPSHSRFTGR
jgi:hypothetical protein